LQLPPALGIVVVNVKTFGQYAKVSISLMAVGLVTAGLAPFAGALNHTTVALTYLLAVLLVATLFGSRPAVVISIAAALCFNFFFLPPYYTLAVSQGENWVALVAFLITALVAGQLSSYARRRADESEERRQEIEKLYRELKDAFAQASQAEALKQSEQLKSALLDAVTHDLRTPLTSIKAAATTLMESEIDLGEEGRRDLLTIIDEETDRLNRFIGGLVDLARIEAGKLEMKSTDIAVTEIVSGALERADLLLAGRVVDVDIPPDVRAVRTDGYSAEEVLYSLIDNAAKYSLSDSGVRISAANGGNGYVEIRVEDQGRGVQPEDRDRIFEKFVRGSSSDIHTTGNGLGLGLAIARGLAESQGGTLEMTDATHKYVTAFVFRLPAAEGTNP
jgi:K+-sensing histidine kinase KdpD